MDKTTEAWLQSITEKIPRAYANGVEEGKKAFITDMWNNICTFDTFTAAFAGRCWNTSNFRPHKDLEIKGNCNYCFYNCGMDADLAKLGVKITITPTHTTSMFEFSSIKGADIDFTNCAILQYTFRYCSTVERLKVKLKQDGTNTFPSTFASCSNLQDFIIESGVIGNSVDLKSCKKLTKASIESIMSHLSTTASFTVTLSQEAVNNAFTTDEWQAVINAKPANVTVSLV